MFKLFYSSNVKTFPSWLKHPEGRQLRILTPPLLIVKIGYNFITFHELN